jgi:multidrug resistance efflux pump
MNWKRIGLVFIVLTAAGLALAFFWPHDRGQVLRLPGVVEIQEVRLGSKVGGRVEKVATTEGAIAEAGQPLVYFAEPELEAQREQQAARLQAAEADLERLKAGARPEEKRAAKEAVEAARAHWELLKAGSRREEIQEARNQLDSMEAEQRMMREKYQRTQRLFSEGKSSSREELEGARAARDNAVAQAAKAKSHLDLLLAGSRPEEIQQAAAQLKQAQANYDLVLAGSRSEDIRAAEARAAEAQGKLQEIEANLKEAIVYAPERVVVEVLAVRKGDLVPPNQPVVRVLRADDLWVKVYVPETELGKVRLNQEVEVTVDAYPGRGFRGKVMQIAAESEFTPRNVQSPSERRYQVFGIKVRVADPEGVFKSGMAAEVTVPLH